MTSQLSSLTSTRRRRITTATTTTTTKNEIILRKNRNNNKSKRNSNNSSSSSIVSVGVRSSSSRSGSSCVGTTAAAGAAAASVSVIASRRRTTTAAAAMSVAWCLACSMSCSPIAVSGFRFGSSSSSTTAATTGAAFASRRRGFRTTTALTLTAARQQARRSFSGRRTSLSTASSLFRRLNDNGGFVSPSLIVRPMTSSTTTEEAAAETEVTASSKACSDGVLPYDILNRKRGLTGNYDPSSFESDIYAWWESSGCFQPDAKKPQQQDESSESSSEETTATKTKKKPYVLPMPPPNVTGRLHMGHAIFVALQDVLARYHRMRGRPVLWLPGTDHAGIATQLQVEKLLAAAGTSRAEAGRDAFLSKVWEYKAEQGGHITRQLRSLGASADWSRERFTMDDDLSRAVTEAFVRLHDKGLVYRGEYMVNWAPLLQTAVSDLEVEYSDEEGTLYYFKYMVEGQEEYIPVATTRPETIVGDTAVCVHPDDDRYRHLVGKRVVVPMSNGRTIPVLADDYVDMEFGTGALKITPGHDPNDYAIGKKFHLDIINVMNRDATMNENAGDRYAGLDRFDCRRRLWSDMEEADLVLRTEPHVQRVPRSQRGGEIIEPMVSRQWFVKTADMGAAALAAVETGDITLVPKRFEKTWYNWLTDIHDWCVSRQLWWGHRIPVWYIVKGGSSSDGNNNQDDDDEAAAAEYIVARNEDEARTKAVEELGYGHDVVLKQEDDVLDTWFSSGLWPFATQGWPDAGESNPDSDLSRFYPATCLETGYDILFFWVARMVMMGIELTGRSPFEVVYLHGLVRAADGSKMSKTKGNVIDPVDTVEEYGADSLRYSLVTGVTPGQDVPLNMEKIRSNRNFANKLWNCCKFVTASALKDVSEQEWLQLAVSGPILQNEFDQLALPEQYIVSKCHDLVTAVTSDLEGYQLGAAGSKVYEFLWDQYADWYIEISKTRLYEGATIDGTIDLERAKQARRVLVYVLDTSLRLLHPYMPYVTEQLWHHLPRTERVAEEESPNTLMLADWPQMDDTTPLITSDAAVRKFECFQALTKSIRNARAEYNVELGKRIPCTVVTTSTTVRDWLLPELKSLVALAKLDPDHVTIRVATEEDKDDDDEESVQLVVQDGVEAYLPLSGLIDKEKEKQRLVRQKEKLDKEIQKLSSRLESKGFVDKAPAAVVNKARLELAELQDQADKVASSLSNLL